MHGLKDAPGSVSIRGLERAIRVQAVIFAALALYFGGLYLRDRYLRPADVSPIERHRTMVESWVRADPSDLGVRVALANAYMQEGRHEDALNQVRQVLEAAPDRQEALLIAGIAWVHVDQPSAALEPLNRFVTLRRDGPMSGADTSLESAYYYLGSSYLALQRPDEAVDALESALHIAPGDANVIFLLARAHQAAGRVEEALAGYYEAVRFVPDFTLAYDAMAECYATLDQPDHLSYAEGMSAFSVKDYDTAHDKLSSAAAALPHFAAAHLGLGLTHEALDDPVSALADLERALALDPADYVAQHALGRVRAALSRGDPS